MDPLRFGVRNIIGLTIPGAIVVLSICFGISVPGPQGLQQVIPFTQAPATVLLTVGFLVSFVVGSILSLRAPERADRLSAALARRRHDDNSDTKLWERAQKRLADVLPQPLPDEIGQLDLRDLWITDNFPYPLWSLIRLAVYCPKDALPFYRDDVEPILAQVGKSPHFFNYCKLAVYCGRNGVASPLASEIQEAESNIRFLSGAFDALIMSSGVLVGFALHDALRPSHWFFLCCLFVVLIPTYNVIGPEVIPRGKEPKRRLWFSLVGLVSVASLIAQLAARWQFPAFGAVAATECLLAYWIVADGRLRRRRHREVATVVDAYYLSHKTQIDSRGGNESTVQKRVDSDAGE